MSDSSDGTVAARIIRKCGGPRAVAAALGIDVSSVHKWKYPVSRGGSGGVVPTIRQQDLLNWARSSGIDLAPDDFFEAIVAAAEVSP